MDNFDAADGTRLAYHRIEVGTPGRRIGFLDIDVIEPWARHWPMVWRARRVHLRRAASSARRTVGPLARALNDRSLLVAPRALAEAARIVSTRSRGPRHCRGSVLRPPA